MSEIILDLPHGTGAGTITIGPHRQHPTPVDVREFRAPSDPDDGPAIERAHANHAAVMYPAGDYDPGAPNNVYGHGRYTNALGPRWMSGTTQNPTPRAEPIIWAQKHTRTDRTDSPGEWDQGAFYGSLMKHAGNAYGAAVTGYTRHVSPDGGQVIGVHGRGEARLPESQVWGVWAYAKSANKNVAAHTTIALEVNVDNSSPDQGWSRMSQIGVSRGILVVTQDSSNPITHGVYVGRGHRAPNGKIHSGYVLAPNAIMPSGKNDSTRINNNEAFRIEGASTIGDSYNGLRFGGGHFRTGISFTESNFSNHAAIVMGDGHRIVVGNGPSANRWVGFSMDNVVNFRNLSLSINETVVVGARKTGWEAPVGATSRSSFDTGNATTQEVAQRLAALVEDLQSHGLIGE